MSRQELQQENLQLQNQVRELRRKCAIIRDLIDDLQKHFEASKRVGALHRYNMLKVMVKKVIHDELIWEGTGVNYLEWSLVLQWETGGHCGRVCVVREVCEKM